MSLDTPGVVRFINCIDEDSRLRVEQPVGRVMTRRKHSLPSPCAGTSRA